MKDKTGQLNSSVLSFPERSRGGNPRYRGNMNPAIYRELFSITGPQSYCDVMSGSGSALDAARAWGIEKVWGFDLRDGFDAVKMRLLDAVGQEVDLVTSHPPYEQCIPYSGSMWGDAPHPDDLSHMPLHEFYDALHAVLLNQREATKPGGHYVMLIGDVRKSQQVFHSLQAEMLTRMPPSELRHISLKVQHNVQSERKTYGRTVYPFIYHEFVLVWQRVKESVYALWLELCQENKRRERGTWLALMVSAMRTLGGNRREVPCSDLYGYVGKAAPERVKKNRHYEAKIRQVLGQHPDRFKRVRNGVYMLA